MLTGRSFFEYLGQLIGPQPDHNALTVAQILDLPCREAASQNIPRFHSSARINDMLQRILREEGDEFSEHSGCSPGRTPGRCGPEGASHYPGIVGDLIFLPWWIAIVPNMRHT